MDDDEQNDNQNQLGDNKESKPEVMFIYLMNLKQVVFSPDLLKKFQGKPVIVKISSTKYNDVNQEQKFQAIKHCQSFNVSYLFHMGKNVQIDVNISILDISICNTQLKVDQMKFGIYKKSISLTLGALEVGTVEIDVTKPLKESLSNKMNATDYKTNKKKTKNKIENPLSQNNKKPTYQRGDLENMNSMELLETFNPKSHAKFLQKMTVSPDQYTIPSTIGICPTYTFPKGSRKQQILKTTSDSDNLQLPNFNQVVKTTNTSFSFPKSKRANSSFAEYDQSDLDKRKKLNSTKQPQLKPFKKKVSNKKQQINEELQLGNIKVQVKEKDMSKFIDYDDQEIHGRFDYQDMKDNNRTVRLEPKYIQSPRLKKEVEVLSPRLKNKMNDSTDKIIDLYNRANAIIEKHQTKQDEFLKSIHSYSPRLKEKKIDDSLMNEV